MVYFITGFLTCWILCLISFCIENSCQDGKDLLVWSLYLIFAPFVWLVMIPVDFFRNVIKPINQETFEIVYEPLYGENTYHICEDIYLHHNMEAQRVGRKWFLVRIIRKKKNFEELY